MSMLFEMNKFFFSILLFAWSLVSSAGQNIVATLSVNAWDLEAPKLTAERMRASGFTHATLYVPWVDVEPTQGRFHYEKFDRWMKGLVDGGVGLIILLDFGGASYYNDSGVKTGKTVLPNWVIENYQSESMRDFSGNPAIQISFLSESAKRLASRFVESSIKHFNEKFGSSIFGYAVGIQEERELKYGQTGYQWRDYSWSFVKEFRQKYNSDPPVINYNNDIMVGAFKKEPLLFPFYSMRDKYLVENVCHYASIIRSNGKLMVGYFGEIFTSHDGIYGGGVVEGLGACVDVAVVDFNFYDGYKLKADENILPLMANYLSNNGFRKILVGVYAERWANHGEGKKLLPTINSTIEKSLQNKSVIGYEFAGYYKSIKQDQVNTIDFDELRLLDRYNKPSHNGRNKLKIGILSSRANFDFWHGERSNDRNIHQDALVGAYSLLSVIQDLEIFVIGDRVVDENKNLIHSLDAIFVPHQVTLQKHTKEALKEFWENGGVLIQDMRLGEFALDGTSTGDWLNDVFGIENFQMSAHAANFLYENKVVNLDVKEQMYANHAVIGAMPGYHVKAKILEKNWTGWRGWLKGWFDRVRNQVTVEENRGLIVVGDRSLVFGFVPQLEERGGGAEWRKIFVKEILELVSKQSAKN